jgi:hypothetical protein
MTQLLIGGGESAGCPQVANNRGLASCGGWGID